MNLIEGEDYYIENGRWIFTSKYHLKRGSCCGNGCKHCPFNPRHQKGNREVDYDFLKNFEK